MLGRSNSLPKITERSIFNFANKNGLVQSARAGLSQFPKSDSLDEIAGVINEINPESVQPIPNVEAMENLKFTECLSGELVRRGIQVKVQ